VAEPKLSDLIVQIWTVNAFYNFGSNRFRKYGKCCPWWTTLNILQWLCHGVTTAASMKYIGGWYFTIYRSFVGRWFPASNWCVLIGTVVITVGQICPFKKMGGFLCY